jgi:TPR repeat protein
MSLKPADQEDAQAQRNIGNAYYFGNGVAEDKAEAMKWWLKAADQGDDQAQCWLGYCYQNGEGVSIDTNEAVKWYRKAADQGNSTASQNLKSLGP